MLFGIYPGSATSDGKGGATAGPADDPARILSALESLQGDERRPFAVRAYQAYTDAAAQASQDSQAGPRPDAQLTPANVTRYLGHGRRLDLVVMYQSASADIPGYCSFVREAVARYGESIVTLQVGEEPNATHDPTLDGYYPKAAEAVIAGVSAAKAEASRLGYQHLQVGFNTTPLFGEANRFIADLTEAGGQRFVDDLDYVGLDFFPDTFRRVPGGQVDAAAAYVLEEHRNQAMNPAGLAAMPLRITEHGWPTGPDRTPERQAEVITMVLMKIADLATPLDIAGYSHFMLRDADSSKPDLFHQFGLMTDGYHPKPAFHAYAELIADLAPALA